MFKILLLLLLLAITVFVASTCCNARQSSKVVDSSSPYIKLNDFLEKYHSERAGEVDRDDDHYDDDDDDDYNQNYKSIVEQYTKSEEFRASDRATPDLGRLANSLIGLNMEDPCNKVNMESLRQIVEIVLKYDKRAFAHANNLNRRLNIIVGENIGRILNEVGCIGDFVEEWNKNYRSNELENELENNLDWLDCLKKESGNSRMMSTLKRAIKWNKQEDSKEVLSQSGLHCLLRDVRVRGTIRRAILFVRKNGYDNRRIVDAIYEEHIGKGCKKLTEGDSYGHLEANK